MNLFGEKLRELRIERGLLLRSAASRLDIDPAILSKIEHGKRNARRPLVEKMESFYNQKPGILIRLWLSDRIVRDIQHESKPGEILKVAENAIAYQTASKPKQVLNLEKYHQVFDLYPAISKAWIFGSYARKEAKSDSDVDILLEVREKSRITLFDLAEIKEKLHLLTGKEVDIVLSRSLKPGFAEQIELEKKLIYEARQTQ